MEPRKKLQIMIFQASIVPPQVLRPSQFLIMSQPTELPNLLVPTVSKLKSRTTGKTHLMIVQVAALVAVPVMLKKRKPNQ